MTQRKDLSGTTFNRLKVLSYSHTKSSNAHWNCLCVCGKQVKVSTCHLKSGHTGSCGCLSRENTSRARKTHGLTKTPEYTTWQRMKSRCYYKGNNRYDRYGGRGIVVCDRWLEPDGLGFLNFLEDMGKRPEGLTLERMDNDGNYEPNNCKWATYKEQANNRGGFFDKK